MELKFIVSQKTSIKVQNYDMMKKFSYTEKFFGTCGNNISPLTLCHYDY